MLIRISLIIAIIAGLAAGAINFIKVKEIITTTRQARDDFEKNLNSETTAHGKTKKELTGTKEKLTATVETLKTTEEARDTAQADAEKNLKLATERAEKLKATTQERDAAQGDLAAWKALGIPVNDVKTLIVSMKEATATIAAQKDEMRILSNRNRKLQAKIDEILTPDYRVQLPETLKATVTAVDPKWEFVVLNVGEDDGVLENGELLINRNGKLVAKVRVTTAIQRDRCIANLVPGWKLSDIIEGDFAIPSF